MILHYVKCINCQKFILASAKNCPYCGKNQHPNSNAKRDLLIVKGLEQPFSTLNSIGREYGLTRERIRQIYHRITGKKYTELIKTKSLARQKIKNNDMIKSFSKFCSACGKPISYEEHVKYPIREFCSDCHYISHTIKRDPKIFIKCDYCGKLFHPFRYKKYIKPAKNNFCSLSCAIKFKKQNGVQKKQSKQKKLLFKSMR
jgi:predicted amidophosphoribosyltransferase